MQIALMWLGQRPSLIFVIVVLICGGICGSKSFAMLLKIVLAAFKPSISLK